MREHNRSAWVFRLSNAELVETFETAIKVLDFRGDAPDVLLRLDILHSEISRREREGLLTGDDWLDDSSRPPGFSEFTPPRPRHQRGERND